MRIVTPTYEILQIPNGQEALALLERIGRIAYKSEHKIDDGREYMLPGEGTRGVFRQVREPSSHAFLRMILKSEREGKLISDVESMLAEPDDYTATDIVEHILFQLQHNPPHMSVIEHCSATVLFTVNRGVTHELVRHRIAAFTQESTRYCNYAKGRFDNQITVTERPEFKGEDAILGAFDAWCDIVAEAERGYMRLIEMGVKPQIARDVLPNVLKAEIVCTANFREWNHIFNLRCGKAAHPDMRRIMLPLREDFRTRIPIIFGDADPELHAKLQDTLR